MSTYNILITFREVFITNFTTVALILLLWKVMGSKSPSQQAQPLFDGGIEKLLSDDTKNVIDCAKKLADANASAEDKTGAIFQIMSNPSVIETFGKMMGGDAPAKEEKNTNEEGYTFEGRSEESRKFFEPIADIADVEVKNKLRKFYDDWYVK